MAPDTDIGARTNEWIVVFRRVRFPAAMLSRARVSEVTVKAVGHARAGYASPDGTSIRPGEYRLAVELGLSARAVRRADAVLRESGLIEMTHRGSRKAHRADEYRLILAADLMDRVEVRSPGEIHAEIGRLAAAAAKFYRTPGSSRNGSIGPAGQFLEDPRVLPPSIDTLQETGPPSVPAGVSENGSDRYAHARAGKPPGPALAPDDPLRHRLHTLSLAHGGKPLLAADGDTSGEAPAAVVLDLSSRARGDDPSRDAAADPFAPALPPTGTGG
jgi:hypothetical protein